MTSLFLIFFFLDIVLLGIIGSIDGVLVLLFLIPWTFLIYGVLCFKGFTFSGNDELYKSAGRLYWIGQGVFKATLISVINIVLGLLIIPDSSLVQFDQSFGSFSSILIFVLLPLPGFLIISMQREDQERLYELIYQKMVEKNEAPEFIVLTSELLSKVKQYTKEYNEQLEKIKNYAYQFIEREFHEISPFFHQKQPFQLNIENLAIFLTRRAIRPEDERKDLISSNF